ncbi:MAG: site-2 protease family protein [Candidatus Baltobacteraceae bacterium]|jgi:Zn-dependent protease
MRIGSLFGIEISIDGSWIFVFALVAWVLASPTGPLHLAGVGVAGRVGLGVLASLLFFTSVLLHELAHSLLARKRGIKVSGIRLFIFGGASIFEGEASDAPGEAWISGIGPLTSLVLGVLFYALSLLAASQGAVGAMFRYLCLANVLLAIFNILPAYPLDGGRVLHALLWKASGDRERATRVTARIGRVLAALMIAYGIVETLSVDTFGGLWITFIGWFLLQAGNAEQKGSAVSEALQGHTAGELAAPLELRLPADTTAAGALAAMQQARVRALPVFVGDQLLGVVTASELTRLSDDERAQTYVTAVMTRVDDLTSVPASMPAKEAVAQLARSGAEAIVLIAAGGALAGVFTRESVVHWLADLKHVS